MNTDIQCKRLSPREIKSLVQKYGNLDDLRLIVELINNDPHFQDKYGEIIPIKDIIVSLSISTHGSVITYYAIYEDRGYVKYVKILQQKSRETKRLETETLTYYITGISNRIETDGYHCYPNHAGSMADYLLYLNELTDLFSDFSYDKFHEYPEKLKRAISILQEINDISA